MKLTLDLTPEEFQAVHAEVTRIAGTTHRDGGKRSKLFQGTLRKLDDARKACSLKVSNITNCARCGGNHPLAIDAALLSRPFAPPEAGGTEWTHWFSCPVTNEPVMVTTNGAVERADGTQTAGRVFLSPDFNAAEMRVHAEYAQRLGDGSCCTNGCKAWDCPNL